MEPAMSTLALHRYESPVSDPDVSPVSRRAIEGNLSPWGIVGTSSGTAAARSVEVNPMTGISFLLGAILRIADRPASLELTTPDVPGALTEIRDAFSLSTVHLAEVLDVSRQAVYDWSAGKTVKPENRQRIGQILEFVGKWRELHPAPMGPVVAEALDGSSLLDLLRADELDSHAIAGQLARIAARLGEIRAERPASARELAAKHGMRPLSEENQRRNLQAARLRHRRHG